MIGFKWTYVNHSLNNILKLLEDLARGCGDGGMGDGMWDGEAATPLSLRQIYTYLYGRERTSTAYGATHRPMTIIYTTYTCVIRLVPFSSLQLAQPNSALGNTSAPARSSPHSNVHIAHSQTARIYERQNLNIPRECFVFILPMTFNRAGI